jgi:periplasmic protein TonB
VTDFRLPLALSLAAHAILLALLMLLPTAAPPLQPPLAAGGIEVAFAPSLPQPEQPPVPQPPVKAETPPPVTETPPPPAIEPPPPSPEATIVTPEPPPPPPRKPAVPILARPALRRPERERSAPSLAAPAPVAASTLPAVAAPTPASAPAPSAEIGPGYRALLSEWLESHKRYPDSARDKGEEGHAVLRFIVERDGQIANFAIVKSSGYPDLDAAIEGMMRGAILPRFPDSMTQTSIEVSVAIRFSLGG